MGISNLMKIVKEVSPFAIYDSNIIRFRGEIIAIDVSIYAHQKFREILPTFVRENEDVEDFTTMEHDTINMPDPWYIDWKKLEKKWLLTFFGMIKDLLIAEITPLLIFDGKAPKIKKQEHHKREKTRKRSEELYENSKKEFYSSKGMFDKNRTREKCKKAFITQTRFNFQLLTILKDFFIRLNLPVLQCVEESDYLIAALVKEGIVKACMSIDTDLIIYGVDYLFIEFRRNMFKIIDVKKFTNDYGGKEKLLDLAILLGTDYNDGITGVGPKTALKLLDKYECLELLPYRYYKSDLNRSVIRDRFTNIKKWKELVVFESSNIEQTIEPYDIKKMKSRGINAFIKYDLQYKWEDCIDGL